MQPKPNEVKRAIISLMKELPDCVFKETTRLALSGGVNTEVVGGDAVLTAKAILYVALLNEAEQYRPLSIDGKKISNNLKRF